MEAVLSYIVVLVALVAILSPIWLCLLPSEPHEQEVAEITKQYRHMCDQVIVMERHTIHDTVGVLLLYDLAEEDYILLD